MADYKASKQAFVSDATGSTITHVNLVSLVALASIALYSALQSRLPPLRLIPALPACLILVLPLLLSMTFFAGSPLTLSLLLLLPTGLLLLVPARDSSALPDSSSRRNETNDRAATVLPIEPLPALTTYRAHMMLMTVLAILAVDFPIFPRYLAKCETFGVSLMDIGVGSFVFSQGVVSAIPILKNPGYLTRPVWRKLPTVLSKMLPIIFLGVVRVILVKGVDYPEHESEYGTHWNFFITLALLPILQVLLHPLILHLPVSFIAVLIAMAHELGLAWLGLENYVLTSPRTNLISSNKEGLVSLTGYLAIHLLGLSVGTLILPPSPNYFRRYQQHRGNTPVPVISRRQNDKTATELFSYAVVWWSLLGLSKLCGIGSNVSRRMANLQYVLWIAAYNTSFIFGYLLIDLYFFPSPLSKSVYSPTSKLKVPVEPTSVLFAGKQLGNPPPLFEAINKNGLALFLLANVATGLINLAIRTMYTSDLFSVLILCTYSFGICFVAWIFRNRRLINL